MPQALVRLTEDSLQTLDGLSPRGIRLGLESIREILERLDHPERKVPWILIGGTNGKGSVAATLSSILRAAGLRVGLHTSPHLIDVTERIRVADEDVDSASFGAALEQVFRAARKAPAVPVTYFEAVTAAADWIFADRGCDFAVVEVGLGGRLDATNASDPILSIVSSISLDHTAELGGTVEAIAREKAGIFRRGRLAICGGSDGAALAALAGESRAAGATFVSALDSVRIEGARETATGQSFRLTTLRESYELESPLRGGHQIENVALAVLAAEELASLRPSVTPAAIRDGVAATRWPGRLESFRVGSRTVWLDGCHNPAGAAALGRFFEGRPPVDLLFAAMEDKDVVGIAEGLFPVARRVVLTAPSIARAAPPGVLRDRLARVRKDLEIAGSCAEGIETILRGGAPELLVAGSLYLVGEARRILLDRARSEPRSE